MPYQQKYYIYWSDHESGYLDEYDEKQKAEEAASVIRQLESRGRNGTKLHQVVVGTEVKFEDAEIVTGVTFK